MSATRVINLFGGPGAGKTTAASGLFHLMKQAGRNVEFAHEWIKQKVWEGSYPSQPQYYIWAKQLRAVEILLGQVDYVITDSPTLLSYVYGYETESDAFLKVVLERFNSHENINFFIERDKLYNPAGRAQTEEHAKEIDLDLHILLHALGVTHEHVYGNVDAPNVLYEWILNDERMRAYAQQEALTGAEAS